MPFLAKSPETGYWTDIVTEEWIVAKLANVHDPENCAGRGCAIHDHPSDHPLKDAPMLWRDDRNILERVCSHGVGHPDYDSAEYLSSIGMEHENIHGCDGCC